MLKLKELKYGSLLSYVSHHSKNPNEREDIKYAREIKNYLKNDIPVSKKNEPDTAYIPFSDAIAKDIAHSIGGLPFKDFFGDDTTLVPVPKSSLMQPNTLWVPLNVANAFVKNKLASNVVEALERETPVNRSSSVPSKDRPKAEEHYNSLKVNVRSLKTQKIVLIDDIVTRGATLIGSVNKLFDMFPDKEFYAFAVMRTISNISEFKNWYAPVIGTITLQEDGNTLRRP